MKVNFLYTILLSAVFLVCGCDSHKKELSATEEIDVLTASPKMVLVTVDGTPITVADVHTRISFETAIYLYNTKLSKTSGIEAYKDKFIASRVEKIIPELINQKLISKYISDAKISPGEKEVNDIISTELKKFKFKGGLEKFAAELKVSEEYLKELLLLSHNIECARNHFGNGPFTVTDEEIDAGLARQTRYYERAVSSNAVTYVTASNLYNRIVKENLDFEKAGLEFGQYEKEEAKYWDRLEASEMENPEMKKWAFTAPIGSVGGPFDLDDGLSIVKILDRSEGTIEPSMASAMVADVSLARITFYMIVTEPEPRTRDFVRNTLLKQKNIKAQKALFAYLQENAIIKYPNGDNIVYNLKGGLK